MEHHNYAHPFAAGVVLLLAVIFIIGCGSTGASLPTATQAAATVTPVPATSTPSPTPKPPGPTATPTPPPGPTASPSPTPTATQADTPTPTTEPTEPPPAPTKANSPAKAEPTADAPVTSGVAVYTTTVTLPTYPFRDYLVEQVDPVYNIPVYYLNRAQYEAAQPTPTPVDYSGVVLENPYLRLTFLPQLGGRLYSAVVKATGQEIFYQNPVVKPSRYGVLQPYEANWWLATGGMEWAYPTQEHGYRFGVAWDYSVSQTNSGATITLSDAAPNRVSLSVDVTLPAGSALFTVAPHLTNNGPETVPVQLWTNAALTLTSGSMSPKTQFIVPTQAITVHSRGESGWSVPEAQSEAPWPRVGSTNLQNYSQWANYLGFFVPNRETPFVGAYNPGTNLGIAKLPAPGPAVGSSKLFAFGPDFPDRSYTDDDSQYFEIWGSANYSFWPEDDIPVAPAETLGWQESWWPLAGLGGLTWATERVAIHVAQSGTQYTLSALVSAPTQGTVQVRAANATLLNQTFSADPATPLTWKFDISDAPLHITVTDSNNTRLLEYQTN